MPLEIERKFLLKTINEVALSKLCSHRFNIIYQYYKEVDNEIYRYRLCIIKNEEPETKIKYFKTIKKHIESFVFEELEEEITKQEYEKAVKDIDNLKMIHKRRYIFYDKEQNLNFELDYFYHLHLIILEVELPTKETKFTIPEFFNKNIIIEVSGLPQFSNHNLAWPCSELNY